METPFDKFKIIMNDSFFSTYNFNETDCHHASSNDTEQDSTMCPSIWDGFTCWRSATPMSTVYTFCPAVKGSDITKQAFRTCGGEGWWLNRYGLPDVKGWTNYTPCFTEEILQLIQKLSSGSEDEAQEKIKIAERTRLLEIVGNTFSFMALLLSLLIFQSFRSLKNPRTRLHRHLFVAVLIQVAIRLILYIDQVLTRKDLPTTERMVFHGIDNTPILCEAAYIFLQYSRTAMFMWMFVEGLYLHNMITISVFGEKFSSSLYPFVGWGVPVPLTALWAVLTGIFYGKTTCWWGYNLTSIFWVLEGPRMVILMINLAFMLNIIRVLVTKLKSSRSSEIQQVRKAVKAALILLPLLGITNFLGMIEAPLEGSTFEFALWSYTTHVLSSTQGFVLSVLYCFRNGEVQFAVSKFFQMRLLRNRMYEPSRHSLNFNGNVTNECGRTEQLIKLAHTNKEEISSSFIKKESMEESTSKEKEMDRMTEKNSSMENVLVLEGRKSLEEEFGKKTKMSASYEILERKIDTTQFHSGSSSLPLCETSFCCPENEHYYSQSEESNDEHTRDGYNI